MKNKYSDAVVIYNYKIANDLLERGFKMVGIKPNANTYGILVFYFMREEELINVLNKDYNITID